MLTATCPMRSPTPEEWQRLKDGELFFIDGEWIDDPLLIAAMRATAKMEV